MSSVELRVGHVSTIPPNQGRMLRARGHLVAVFRLRDGGVRATQPWCPHLGGPLADGLVGDGALVCPLHGRTFDLSTGEAQREETGVETYPARVDSDGAIVVSVPADGPLPCRSDVDATPAAPEAGDATPPFTAAVE